MYKIIGADGQQYGPVNLEQMRRWLAENRVRAESLVQAEGSADWKPLSSYPELAAELKSAPPTIGSIAAPSALSNPRASNKVAAGICGILLGGFGVHKFVLGYTGAGIIMLLISVLSCGTLYGVMHIIGLIEGIVYLTKTDDEFVHLYVDGRKEWFYGFLKYCSRRH
jgi:TM2 domain-containing membrane protein YozV